MHAWIPPLFKAIFKTAARVKPGTNHGIPLQLLAAHTAILMMLLSTDDPWGEGIDPQNELPAELNEDNLGFAGIESPDLLPTEILSGDMTLSEALNRPTASHPNSPYFSGLQDQYSMIQPIPPDQVAQLQYILEHAEVQSVPPQLVEQIRNALLSGRPDQLNAALSASRELLGFEDVVEQRIKLRFGDDD